MKLYDRLYKAFMWRVVQPAVVYLCNRIQPDGLCDGFANDAEPRCPKHDYPLMDGVCRVCQIDAIHIARS